MQSKIISFFKPSSSSPIATSVTPDITDDDGLTAWENNRNVIVNTYERRSPKSDRSEALQECIGKPPRKGPETLNKKRSYTQFHLELGQSDFLLRHCVECGATYAPGDELDEKSHQSFHKDYMSGIPFKVGRTREPSHRLLWARTVLLWYWKMILLRIETRCKRL